MTVESAADLASLFDTGEFAVAATYRAGGLLAGVVVSVIRDQGTEVAGLLGTGFAATAHRLIVRVADVASPADGDTLTIGAETLTVAAVALDASAVLWTLECR